MAQSCRTNPTLGSLGLRIAAALAFLAPLLTRLVVGGVSTRPAMANSRTGRVTRFFTSLGIPFPARQRHFHLLAGIYRRPLPGASAWERAFSPFLLSSTMMVALLPPTGKVLQKFPADLTDVASFTYLLFLIWLVLYGPGPISIDYFLSKWLGLNGKTGESK